MHLQKDRFFDDYGEEWVVIDGVETKVPRVKHARALLVRQDALRIMIRADLDATGVRDRTVKQKIKLDDGTEAEVELLPPGDAGANVLQIENFPDAEKFMIHIDRAISEQELEARRHEAAAERARDARRPLYQKVFSFLRSLGR